MNIHEIDLSADLSCLEATSDGRSIGTVSIYMCLMDRVAFLTIKEKGIKEKKVDSTIKYTGN